MNKAGGYIAIHRQITDWEWYKDTATKSLFIHLLVTANFKDTRFMGKLIRRGEVVTSLPSLAEETGLTIQNIRTALKHLKSTGEVTDKSNRQYRVITVVKYDDYQKLTDNLTVSQQTANRQLTDSQQYHNNDNKVNKVNKAIKREGAFAPPTLDEVRSYVNEKGLSMSPEAFFDHFSASGWVMKGGQRIKDWKAAARNWARREGSFQAPTKQPEKKIPGQDYDQRNYSSVDDEAYNRLIARLEGGKGNAV